MKNALLSKVEVQHIAQLANLTLKEEEITKFQIQLSSILDYIEKLQNLDAKNVKQTNQVTGLKNVADKDNTLRSLDNKEALSNANKKHDSCFKVKSIF